MSDFPLSRGTPEVGGDHADIHQSTCEVTIMMYYDQSTIVPVVH